MHYSGTQQQVRKHPHQQESLCLHDRSELVTAGGISLAGTGKFLKYLENTGFELDNDGVHFLILLN